MFVITCTVSHCFNCLCRRQLTVLIHQGPSTVRRSPWTLDRSVSEVSEGFPVEVLDVIEIVATLLFTVEYALRYFSTPEATEVTKILTSGALGNIYPPKVVGYLSSTCHMHIASLRLRLWFWEAAIQAPEWAAKGYALISVEEGMEGVQ